MQALGKKNHNPPVPYLMEGVHLRPQAEFEVELARLDGESDESDEEDNLDEERTLNIGCLSLNQDQNSTSTESCSAAEKARKVFFGL